jgi:NarL family two-component system response regulator LiaR
MPLKDGITAIQEILQTSPEARILVLTSFPDDDKVFRAIKAGAMGYHLKEAAPELLVESIRAIHRGEVALHPSVARKLMQEIKHPHTLNQEGESLTLRELDVLKCLARGLSNQEIARELSVSVRTVTTHIRNILEKLHLANRTQAALYAVERGIATQPATRAP